MQNFTQRGVHFTWHGNSYTGTIGKKRLAVVFRGRHYYYFWYNEPELRIEAESFEDAAGRAFDELHLRFSEKCRGFLECLAREEANA